jgi:hydroxyacylglutathione hydrolase
MKIKTFLGGYDHNFTYVVYNESKCCVIDPAISAQEVLSFVKENGLEVAFVVFLHSHFDHIVDLDKYRSAGIPIYGHESTKIVVDKGLKEGGTIGFGDVKFDVLHTPGHCFDCLCLKLGDKLFTSDTLFVEGCGRVDLEGSEPEKMVETLERLKNLPDNTIFYPGHDYGSTETSTIGREKENNRFFRMNKEEFLRDRWGGR